MILPNKYISYEDSIISDSNKIMGILLAASDGSNKIEFIWKEYKKQNDKENRNCSFSKFYLAILLLGMMKLISVNEEGEINAKKN